MANATAWQPCLQHTLIEMADMGKASKRKRLRRESECSMAERAARMFKELTGDKTDVVVKTDLLQEQKISGALATLLEPLMSPASTPEQNLAMLASVVTAWNISVLSTDAQQVAIEKLADDLCEGDEEMRVDVIEHFQNLVANKQAQFPHDKRWVIDWNGQVEGGNFRVTAAAAHTQPAA